MSQESKTPRTDANAWKDGSMRVVSADFARQLERELAAVTEERDALIASARIKEANSGWRPIETAPKDGAEVLIYVPDPGEQFVAYWHPQFSAWLYASTYSGVRVFTKEATHWMPLPAPPTTEPGQ